MARTPTTQIPLGFKAPDFNLPNVVSNKTTSLSDVAKKWACSYVHMQSLPICNSRFKGNYCACKRLSKKDIGFFVAISSNDIINYPDDDPQKMKKLALENNFTFDYLLR